MTPTPFASRRLAALLTVAGLCALYPGGLVAQRGAIPAKTDARTVTHVLDRIGFGARPGDVARVQQMGLAAYIESQLHPERVANTATDERLAAFGTLTMSTSEQAEKYYLPALEMRRQQDRQQAQAAAQGRGGDMTMAGGQPPAQPMLTPEQRQVQQGQQLASNELMQAKILRAVMSERQLEEVLVDFWFNHFNVFVGKGQVRQYLTEYERDAIRPNVLGSFRTLLGATAHSPAMLFYLDNFQSRTPNPPVVISPEMEQRLKNPRLTPQQRQQLEQRMEQMRNQQRRPQGGLNENYARELMELHTLGVDAGYTQQDVIEVARILTGWTIDRPQQGGSFVFRPQMHDAGTKTVLGKPFQAGGEDEGERLLDMLAAHPATAKHISYKLAQRFIADEPPAALVDRAAKKFLDTKGDLREVTRLIITSPEFFSEDYHRAKVKTPLEFIVSAARATGATVVNPQPMVQALRELGMPLYGAQPPTGYSMTADAWVNTGALLSRMNFAQQLVSGGQPLRGPAMGGDQPGRPNAQGRGTPPARANQQGRGGQQLRPAQLARMPIQVDVNVLAPDVSETSQQALVDAMLAGEASGATRQTLARASTPQQLIALTLGSPEFQRR